MTSIKLRREGRIQPLQSLRGLFADHSGDRVLFVSPHDDDANIGAGLAIAQLVAEGCEVHVAIASDGRMGYCSAEEQKSIVAIRARETVAAYSLLGVKAEHIYRGDFPDGILYQYLGRRPAQPADPELRGHTGLQNYLTWVLRRVRPSAVFLPASTDLHPDHQAVYKDLLISLFHAGGEIWPELGEPCAVPAVFEFPLYVALDGDPDVMIEAQTEVFQRKLDSIAAFASQRQIKVTVDNIRASGPREYLRNLNFAFYNPAVYRQLFA